MQLAAVKHAPWRWADASGEPLIINGLPQGPHKVLIELVNANHQTVDKGSSPPGFQPNRLEHIGGGGSEALSPRRKTFGWTGAAVSAQ